MLKKLFTIFKRSQSASNSQQNYITAELNDKVGPIDREAVYGDPLNIWLKNYNYGEVTGGGTFLEKDGSIACCDLEILLWSNTIDKNIITAICAQLEMLGAPKGSKIIIDENEKIEFGKKEGLALILDNANLPEEIYTQYDINFVWSEIHRLTNIERNADRFRGSESETALYLYDASFEEMKNAITAFVNTYPLCQGARIEQIA
jgi:hypothetical protein